MKLASIF